MNTITLNGVSSSTIQGLLIQELPPISKPKIRTQTEEIDGRDGDIVTRLGYSAYDKEIKIGLTYGYDVDDVIAYFDSQGIVIFSNEPDKYYNYQINEQIDFERLIRFKQAKVKFHVQPFKYKVGEEPVTYTPETETVSGSIVTFDGTAGTSIKSLVANIEPIQSGSGDPSPSNVRPISGYEGVNVTRVGKNLFHNVATSTTQNGTTFTRNADGSITVSGKPTSKATILINDGYMSNNPAIFSYGIPMPSGTRIYAMCVYNGATTYPTLSSNSNPYVPLSGNGEYLQTMALEINTSFSGTSFTIYPMIELGSTATAYEPYQGETITKSLGQTVYGGTLDVVSGKLVIDREFKQVASTDAMRMVGDICQVNYAPPSDNAWQSLICSHFPTKSIWSGTTNEGIGCWGGQFYFRWLAIGTTIEAWRQFFTDNNVQFTYTLATPIEVNLTPTEVNTLLGSNNIWADSGEVSVGIVKADLTAVNEGNIFAKPTLYLEGSGTVGVLVNGEEALSIDMSEIPHITIDVPEMNAYYDTELANRKVTGDPDDLFLNVGTDTISFTGNVTKAELTEYSRWI